MGLFFKNGPYGGGVLLAGMGVTHHSWVLRFTQ